MTEALSALGAAVDPAAITLAFAFGALAGLVYLALLWASVRGLAHSAHPLARLLLGAVLRIGLLLVAIFVVMDGDWQRILASLAGFLAIRVVVTRLARVPAEISLKGS